jgi:gamma-glutamylcyclotransferase (GGCT)/AIG2-like uncharacterized protein YtfP
LIDYLFVYGTLRKYRDGRMHPFLLEASSCVDTATMPGKLYEVQNYPAAIACPDDNSHKVHGEIYRLHDAEKLLHLLDDYEECTDRFPDPHEYVRCKTSVTLPDNTTLIAWVYLYNWPIAGLENINSGDYRQYLQDHPSSNRA